MNHKRLIALTICFILSVVPGLSVLSFAGNESGTNAKAERHLEKANELRKLADYDAAIAEYQTVISLSSNSKIAQNAQYWIGQLYFESKQFDAALSAFNKLLDEYPESKTIPATTLMIERVQQAKKNKSLFKAVKKGDIEQVKSLISKGADVNVKDESGNTALHIALDNDSNDIAEFLIDQGADVNATGQKNFLNNYRPLYISINHRNKDMVKLLLSKGADVYVTNDRGGFFGSSLLTMAIGIQDLDIISLLLENGAKLDVKDENGWTDLHNAAEGGYSSSRDIVEFFISKIVDSSSLYMAAFTGDLTRVQELIEQGTEVDTKDEAGWTALFWAACGGQTDIAEFLINNGADVNKRSPVGSSSDTGTTPLHQAAKIGEPDLAELLVSKGADIDASAEFYTPLDFAITGGHLKVVEVLVSKGADVNAINRIGQTPLHLACQSGNKEIVEFLINKGADVNPKPAVERFAGRTPLYSAVQSGNKEIVELLISHGADITTEIINIAERRGQTEIVELLREHGAEEGSSSGESDAKPANSPLHEAATAGDIEQVRMLISQGAEVDTKDNRGGTPLHNAGANGRMEVAELLIENGAEVNAQHNQGGTPLLLAARRGHKDIVELLIVNGADVNAKNKWGWMPLHGAIEGYRYLNYGVKGRSWTPLPSVVERYPDVADLLIDKGADINAKGLKGCTPLHSATYDGHRLFVQFLLDKGADVNVKNDEGQTALYVAREKGHTEIVELLKKHGAKE